MKTNKNGYLLVVPFALFLISFLSKLFFINTRDICMDDPFTIFHAQKSIHDILLLPTQNEPNPPLFMVLLHFWIKLFGIEPGSVRLLPLLFNSATPIFIYLTGKKLLNVWSGIFAAGLFIFSTFHFYFGLEVRAYAMLSFGTSAALYYFISLSKTPDSRKYLLGLIIANILMIYSHYFGWFVVFIQAVLSLFYFSEKRFLKSMAINLLVSGIAFFPMAIVFVKQFLKSKQGTWLTAPSNSEYMNQLKQFFNTTIVLKVFIVVCIVGLFVAIVKKADKQKLKELLVVFLWWIIPYTLMFLVSAKIPMFLNRYILFNTIGLYVFVGFFINWAFLNIKKSGVIISISMLILMVSNIEINSKYFYYREVKNTVNYVKQQQDSSSIIIIHPHWASLGFTYYFDKEIFKDVLDYDNKLSEHRIYPVWNVDFVKEIVKKQPDVKIIYYQDGSIFNDNNNTIFKYLNEKYERIDSVFFPECFYVSVYKPNVNDSLHFVK